MPSHRGGKSTVMALIQRFYDPVEGAVGSLRLCWPGVDDVQAHPLTRCVSSRIGSSAEVLIGEQRANLASLNIRWWRRKACGARSGGIGRPSDPLIRSVELWMVSSLQPCGDCLGPIFEGGLCWPRAHPFQHHCAEQCSLWVRILTFGALVQAFRF